MRFSKFATLCVLSLLALSFFTEQAEARKRRKRYLGRQGKYCQEYPAPDICRDSSGQPAIQPKNYKSANGVPRLQKEMCGPIVKQIQKTPGCVVVIGYRSCKTNSGIRGAARRSRHLCGKAADLRQGTCGELGATHTVGTAAHRHFSPLGACQ